MFYVLLSKKSSFVTRRSRTTFSWSILHKTKTGQNLKFKYRFFTLSFHDIIEGDTAVTRDYLGLQGVTFTTVTGGCKGLVGFTGGYKGLQRLTDGYRKYCCLTNFLLVCFG